MKAIVIIIVMAGFCLCFLYQQPAEQLNLGTSSSKHRHGSLQLIPVIANKAFQDHHRSASNYLTLSQAISQKKVTVTELSGGAAANDQVNTLFIENLSSDTVFILGGEVVQGGKQDRTIARDVVLLPKSGPMDLAVFCVEAHRWHGEDKVFMVMEESLSPASVRETTIEKASQEEVWEKVDEVIQNLEVQAPTSSVRAVANQPELKVTMNAFTNPLKNLFQDDASVVGVIAVSNGEVIACDLFANHNLFQKHYANLLQSYAIDALSDQEAPMDPQKIKKYFTDVVLAKAKSEGFVHSTKANHKIIPHLSTF